MPRRLFHKYGEKTRFLETKAVMPRGNLKLQTMYAYVQTNIIAVSFKTSKSSLGLHERSLQEHMHSHLYGWKKCRGISYYSIQTSYELHVQLKGEKDKLHKYQQNVWRIKKKIVLLFQITNDYHWRSNMKPLIRWHDLEIQE